MTEPGPPIDDEASDDPKTQYPTQYLLQRARTTGRRRKIYWVLMALFAAAGALGFYSRYFG